MKSFLHNNRNRGYSLLELIIYIALFAVISVLLVRSLVTVMKTYAKAQNYRRLQNNGELVMERITREVRASKSIASGVYTTNPGSLTLLQDNEGVPQTVGFSVSDASVQVSVDGSTAPLSTTQVAVTNLIFRTVTTTQGAGIKTELTVTTTSAPIITAKFYSTTLLRK